MKEYTLLAILSVIVTFVIDRVSGGGILKRRNFYFFLIVIFCFKLFVNGYLTGEDIVQYDLRFFLGIRIGSIPMEDFLFGFSMVAQTIIFWEMFKRPRPVHSMEIIMPGPTGPSE